MTTNKRRNQLLDALRRRSLFATMALLSLLLPVSGRSQSDSFQLEEATIADIHAAYEAGRLTSRRLVQLYLDRIEAFDKKGPAINAIVNLNPKALADADRLDAAFKALGP